MKEILVTITLVMPIVGLTALFGTMIWFMIIEHRTKTKREKEFWAKMDQDREEAMSTARIRATQLHNEQIKAMRRIGGGDQPWLEDGK